MRGYSLLECICSLGIISLLTASIVHLTHSSASILSNLSDTLEQRFVMVKTGLVLSASLAALERTHLPGIVTLTDGKNPTTSSGGLHPVRNLRGNTQPRAYSSILSTISVDPRYSGRILKSSFTADTVLIEVCGSPEIPGRNTFRSHLTIGVSGACQLVGTPQRTSDGCFTLSGSPVRGLVSDSCPKHSLLEYLPIISEQSVYVDRTGELRLISHVGARIIENQPIARGLRAIQIHAVHTMHKATIYYFDIFTRTTRSHRFFSAAGLTRETIWNEILL